MNRILSYLCYKPVFQKNRAIRVISPIRVSHIRLIQAFIVLLFVLLAHFSHAQTIQILTSGTQTSLRGLSVVDNKVLWASGSNGTVARSTDGGKTFNWITVKGYGQRDFRDIEAFDSNTAIIMAVAEPAIILKTTDAGKSWKKVFEDSIKGMFLDAMDFEGDAGFVVGDPINGKLFRSVTRDNGDTWEKLNNQEISLPTGEALFAASGTNIKIVFSGTYAAFFYNFIITGGTKSEIIITGSSLTRHKLPLQQGKETQGANSIALGNKNLVIVGGDFANDKDTTGNCILLSNKFHNYKIDTFTFSHPQTPPHGYRSCVEFINDNQLITCGTSGVDISNDGGMNWTLISPESFHVCQKAKQGNAVFLAGKEGRIAKLIF